MTFFFNLLTAFFRSCQCLRTQEHCSILETAQPCYATCLCMQHASHISLPVLYFPMWKFGRSLLFCTFLFFVFQFFESFFLQERKLSLAIVFIRKFQWRSARCYHLLLARRIVYHCFFLAILLYYGLHRQVNLRTRKIYWSILEIETRRPMHARVFVLHSQCIIWLHDELVLCK